jgi:Predicted transcriptional regulators
MLLKIDFQSDIPIYIQLKHQIIQGIASGELKEGESLPSVRQLGGDIGINLHTVNKAYNLLRNDGFIIMDRRQGAIVNIRGVSINDEYIHNLESEMEPVIAEAFVRGMPEDDFIKLCLSIYENYSRGEKK